MPVPQSLALPRFRSPLTEPVVRLSRNGLSSGIMPLAPAEKQRLSTAHEKSGLNCITMRIEGIEFPEAMCTALRNGQLVIFAGAGISMGEPAGLPSFVDLAKSIADSTGFDRGTDEPVDRFLGRLEHAGVDVHARAAQELSPKNAQPTALHRSSLQFFWQRHQVRIVTTNFDELFEQAAKDVLAFTPDVFRAPALPLGRSFNGIVHVHGALSHADGMVLTDGDFGRAYLTEGWARRFLVELFREFSVLFVGYDHNDTVMNYLARALPGGGGNRRFALTGRARDPQHWHVLGIEPIVFPQADPNDYSALNRSVGRLVEIFTRGVLDWRREIVDIARSRPSLLDDEAADLVGEVLADKLKTRFFTEAEPSAEWIAWLDERKHLDALFGDGALSPPDQIMARWLADHFALSEADELFRVIAKHHTKLHPDFWRHLGRAVGSRETSVQNDDDLRRWTVLLAGTAPADTVDYVLPSIGERCAEQELTDGVLLIFDALARSFVRLKSSDPWSDDGGGRQSVEVDFQLVGGLDGLETLWKAIRDMATGPGWKDLAEPLLRIAARRLEERHRKRCAWRAKNHEWDRDSGHRFAIEPHEQNARPQAVDVLIDAARDCLEWLAGHDSRAAERWCEELAASNVPLLRRLAVHNVSQRSDLTADERIGWVLENTGLHYRPAHHEIFRTVGLAYPDAGSECRAKLVESVQAYRPLRDNPVYNERITVRWLEWLCKADPDCQFAKSALHQLQAYNPDIEPEEHPDFLFWMGPVSSEPPAPWNVDELLGKPAADWLPKLLSFQPDGFRILDRRGLVWRIQQAAAREFEWGLALADALRDKKQWDADFWSGLIGAWSSIELDKNGYRRVLDHVAHVELLPRYTREATAILNAVVRDRDAKRTHRLLPSVNAVATRLWTHLDRDEPHQKPDNWLDLAINDSAGALSEFWLRSLDVWRRQQDSTPTSLNEQYSAALSKIVEDDTIAGKLGRTILASRFAFLLAVDGTWTKENLLPFLQADTDSDDYQSTWDGFLASGHLDPVVAEYLGDAIFNGIELIRGDSTDRRKRLVECYTAMLVFFVADPTKQWIPQFFQYANREARCIFAWELGRHLGSAEDGRVREWWSRWLKCYWRNRVQGVPSPLELSEIERMLGWLPDLAAVFSDAIALAIGMLESLSNNQLERAHGLISRLNKNDSLIRDHPEDVARLLIALGRFESPQLWYQGKELIGRLRRSALPSDLQLQLKELEMTLGFSD